MTLCVRTDSVTLSERSSVVYRPELPRIRVETWEDNVSSFMGMNTSQDDPLFMGKLGCSTRVVGGRVCSRTPPRQS